jgi:molybdopterin-guanine dinucleotide biosynthesis protein A
MGYEPKWQLPLAGKPMLEHILARFTPQVEQVIINGSAPELHHYSHTVIPDDTPSSTETPNTPQGPLAGLLAGLRYAHAHHYSWLVSCPCDTPFLPLDYVDTLLQAAHQDHPLCYLAAYQQQLHPVFGLWSTQLIPLLQDTLANSHLRALGFWAKQLNPSATIVTFSDQSLSNSHAFMNINTPDEWRQAERLHQSLQKTP